MADGDPHAQGGLAVFERRGRSRCGPKSLCRASGRLPDKFSADNGYLSGDDLEVMQANGVDAYIATGKGEKTSKVPLDQSERKLVKADFKYHDTVNPFTWPGGKKLIMKQETQDGKRVYRGDAARFFAITG